MDLPPASLTPFQVAVAELFFSLPESDGFLLAGGAALVAQHLTTRSTKDLDLFTRVGRSTASIVGPTFGLEELAGRKLLALFDRAEARDFADVFVLAQRYSIDLIVEHAANIDAGFDRKILATMLGSLTRFDDSDIPVALDAVAELRRFFHDWQQQLLA